MLRRTDWFAFLGIALFVAGIALYFTGSSQRISLIYWLGGPFLWFAGFAILVGWMAARFKNSSSSTRGGEIKSYPLRDRQKGDR